MPDTGRVWLDPNGMAYDWSFSCRDCGEVYIRDERGHHPSTARVKAAMRSHVTALHPQLLPYA